MRKSLVVLFSFPIIIALLSPRGWSGPAESTPVVEPASNTISWYEKKTRKTAWLVKDEIALFPEREHQAALDQAARQFHAGAVITKQTGFVAFVKAPSPFERSHLITRLSSLRSMTRIRQASPVFYTGNVRDPGGRLVPTGGLIVRFPATASAPDIAAIEKQYGLVRRQTFRFKPNTYLYQAGEPLASIDIGNRLYESGRVEYAYPDWLRTRVVRATPNDTLFTDQWHLDNTGQFGGVLGEDVDILTAWDSYLGSPSEVIAVVDDGLEIGHEDLSPNVLAGQSWDYVSGDTDPTAGQHGTAVAGVAAGRGFNSLGITGSAPLAGLIGHRLLGAETDANEADSLSRNNSLIDIYSNSWGPPDDGSRLEGPGPLTEDALAAGASSGRGGRGSIYVWAGGNGHETDNVNYDGYANSRYTLAVAATTNFGDRAYYSERGAALMVNAPSGGGSADVTSADRTGIAGYDTGNYTNGFTGTSAAAPLVAGIAALMLEANPDLTWRDVQHILIETAEQNDPTHIDWSANGAGHPVSHTYGFGRVNALAAVTASASRRVVDPEISAEGTSSPGLPIPDDSLIGVSDAIAVAEDLTVEYVEVTFSAADHTYWGDLEITLTSPEGTESVLAENHLLDVNSHTYDNWRFGIARHFGESSLGTWTLQVRDLASQDTGTLQSWTLRIYGTGAGCGDWNDDGRPDILWRNYADGAGDNYLWYMDGAAKTGGAALPRVNTLTWVIDGLADFNRDGRLDIVWRNYSSGDNYLWYMDGAAKIGGSPLPKVTDLNWVIESAADFNRDGSPDLLWRNYTNGDNYLWYMDGATKTGGAPLPKVTDLDWAIEGAADFNGDGSPDLFWRNYDSGDNYLWYMNGAVKESGHSLDRVSTPGWEVNRICDANQDGSPDLLWRNYTSGDNYLWYMDGGTKTGGEPLGTIDITDWRIE